MAFPTTSLIDDFNRSNEDPLSNGGKWTTAIEGDDDMQLASNMARNASGSAWSSAAWTDETFGPDSEVYATAVNYTDEMYLYVRIVGMAPLYSYELYIESNNVWALYWVDDGTGNQLGATATQTVDDGDVIGLEIIGQNPGAIKAYINEGASWAEVISRSDSAIDPAGYIGFGCRRSTADWDDFSGGTIGAGVVTGSLDVTLDDATLAGTGEQGAIEGALAETLGAATLAAAGTQVLEGVLAETLGAATLAAAGTQVLEGTLAETLDDATLVGTGTVAWVPITGSLNETLDDATLAGAGTQVLEGALAETLGAATLVGTGEQVLEGVLAETLDDVTLVATGTVTWEPITGSLNITLDDATLVGTGTQVLEGALAETLGAATLVGTGTQLLEGVLAETLDDATLVGTGTVAWPPITGSLDETLGAATLAGAGEQVLEGVLAETLDAATLVGTGTQILEGALAETLGAATLAGTGTQVLEGALSSTLDDATLVGTGTVGGGPVTGSLDVTLDALTAVGTGEQVLEGTLGVTLETIDLTTVGRVGAERGVALPRKHGLPRGQGRPGLWRMPVAADSTLLDGLISWWDLDEEKGVRYDAVGDNDLADINTVLYTADGKIGNAATFVKATQEYLRDTTFSGPTGAVYTAGWVRRNGLAPNNGLWGPNGPPDTWCWGLSLVDEEPRMSTMCDGDLITKTHSQALDDGVWHFVEGYFDPVTELQGIALDGSIWETEVQDGTLDNLGNQFWLGGYYNTTYTFNGDIDLVGVWDRVLTADERNELRNLGISIKNPFTDNGEGLREGSVAYYKLEEESGTRYNSANVLSAGLQEDLVHFWELDEESGTRYDSVGDNDLTDVNTVLYAEGKIGNAALFDATFAERLESTVQFTPNPATGWTQGGWVFPTETGVANQGIICIGSHNSRLLRLSDGRAYFALGSQSAILMPPYQIPQDEWSFVLGWYDPVDDKTHVQVNLVEAQQAGTCTNEPDTPFDIAVGTQLTTGSPMDGRLDQIGLWSRVLTLAERTKLYNSGRGRHQGNAYALADVNNVGFTAGKSGNAAQFVKLSGQRLEHTIPPPDGDVWTLACWVKGTAEETCGFMNLGGGAWPNGALATLYTNDGSQLTGVLGNTVAADYSLNQRGGVPLSNNAWHFCVGRFNRIDGQIDLAVDNYWDKANSTTCTIPTVNAPSGIFVGTYHIGTGPSDYAVDEPMFWNRLLSDDEVTALWRQGLGRFHDFNTL